MKFSSYCKICFKHLLFASVFLCAAHNKNEKRLKIYCRKSKSDQRRQTLWPETTDIESERARRIDRLKMETASEVGVQLRRAITATLSKDAAGIGATWSERWSSPTKKSRAACKQWQAKSRLKYKRPSAPARSSAPAITAIIRTKANRPAAAWSQDGGP